jgi:hypothetical protein
VIPKAAKRVAEEEGSGSTTVVIAEGRYAVDKTALLKPDHRTGVTLPAAHGQPADCSALRRLAPTASREKWAGSVAVPTADRGLGLGHRHRSCLDECKRLSRPG